MIGYKVVGRHELVDKMTYQTHCIYKPCIAIRSEKIYDVGLWQGIYDYEGPITLFDTKDHAKDFAYRHCYNAYPRLLSVFECEYEPFETTDEHGDFVDCRLRYYDRSLNEHVAMGHGLHLPGRKLPEGTLLAKSVKLIKEVFV